MFSAPSSVMTMTSSCRTPSSPWLSGAVPLARMRPLRGAPDPSGDQVGAIMRPIFQRVIREYGGVATEATAARAS
jgi:hypothetical protein